MVGEVFLIKNNKAPCFVGSSVMDEEAPKTQSCQLKDDSVQPPGWFQSPLPSEAKGSFVVVKCRRVKILKCNERDVVEFLDTEDAPFIVFRFEFVGSRRAVASHQAPRKALSEDEEGSPSGYGKGKKRQRHTTSEDSDGNLIDVKGDDSDSELTSIEGSESEPIQSRSASNSGPPSKRLRSTKNTVKISSSSGKKRSGEGSKSLLEELKAEIQEKQRLDKALDDKLAAMRKANAETREALKM
ncbi:hypothetical protein B0H10DRAFT_2216142 [Mycena sp. CBHHK59/15]|nr:hypothetical protein B0H10DRAFT_2216142 [Mycena sp. CBHHK59/15]